MPAHICFALVDLFVSIGQTECDICVCVSGFGNVLHLREMSCEVDKDTSKSEQLAFD